MGNRLEGPGIGRMARVAVLPFVAGALLVGCSSGSTRTAPAAPKDGPAVPGTARAAEVEPTPVPPAPLDLGSLTVKPTTSGFAASADAAERCGSSEWRLIGEVDYQQASPVPDQCFGGPHAFDTTWYGLTLPPGEYVISLTIRRGLATGTTSQAFTIAGA